jgi:hypothetical protein
MTVTGEHLTPDAAFGRHDAVGREEVCVRITCTAAFAARLVLATFALGLLVGAILSCAW